MCEAAAGARGTGQSQPDLPYSLPPPRSLHGRQAFLTIPSIPGVFVTNAGALLFTAGNSACAKLLITVGAHLEAYDLYYGTPLHVACVNEHTDCVKVLLNAGGSQMEIQKIYTQQNRRRQNRKEK